MKTRFQTFPASLYLSASTGAEGGGGEAPSDPPAGNEPTDKTFTQDDIDRVVADRLARERQKYADYDDIKRRAAEYDKLQESQKSELQKAQDAQQQAEADRDEVLKNSNQRAINAEARVQASELGIKADRITHALRLADLTSVKVSDQGEPDSAGVKAAIEAVLKDLPELRGGGTTTRSGAEFRNGNTQQEAEPTPGIGRLRQAYSQTVKRS